MFARRLSRSGAAVAGWQGARNLGGECAVAIEDADLFPPENVTLNGMKIYSDRYVPQIIGYAAAVVETAGSGLVPLFQQIRKIRTDGITPSIPSAAMRAAGSARSSAAMWC